MSSCARPDQSYESPGGTGGFDLHRWHSDREQGGRVVDKAWADSLLRPRGAYLMGRNMYGPVRGPWSSWEDERGEWRGWWGEEPPYHAPVVVLTHHEHDPVELDGTTFHFETGGFDAGLARARQLGDGDVHVAGGAATIRQALAAGVVDSLALDIAPVLLGDGERIFDGSVRPSLRVVEVGDSPYATHVRYDVG
jgi:dihydrofolate reductase